LIDILMPFYGDQDLLVQAVSSVLGQNDPRWRLTVVDDNAQPSTVGSWIESLDDSRIRYLINESTLGVTGNFQRCLELASADFVMFAGCDDVLLPGYVRTMMAAVQRFPDAAAYHPRVQVIDAGGATALPLADRVKKLLAPRIANDALLGGEGLVAGLMRGNWLYFPAITWRRSKLGGFTFRQDLPTVLDLDLLVTLVLAGEQLAVLTEEAFAYRRHGASASSRAAVATERFEEEAAFFADCRQSFEVRGWMRAGRAAAWHLTSRLHAALLVPGAIRSGHWQSARRLAAHAFTRR